MRNSSLVKIKYSLVVFAGQTQARLLHTYCSLLGFWTNNTTCQLPWLISSFIYELSDAISQLGNDDDPTAVCINVKVKG